MVFPILERCSPKLKLGENEKARCNDNDAGCHDNQQLRSNPGLKLANAFGVNTLPALTQSITVKSQNGSDTKHVPGHSYAEGV